MPRPLAFADLFGVSPWTAFRYGCPRERGVLMPYFAERLLVSVPAGVAVAYRASSLVGAIVFAGFVAAVAAFICCIYPLVFPALSNSSTMSVAFLLTMRFLAIAALGVGFLLVYASKIEPPEWARLLLWLGAVFVAIEVTVPWWYPSVAPRM